MRKFMTCFVACILITVYCALPECVNAKTYAVNDYVKVLVLAEQDNTNWSKATIINCRIKTVYPDGLMELEGTKRCQIGDVVSTLHMSGKITQSDVGANGIVNSTDISDFDIYEATVEQADSKLAKKKKYAKTASNQKIAKAVFFDGKTFEFLNVLSGVSLLGGTDPQNKNYYNSAEIDGVKFGAIIQQSTNEEHEYGGVWLLLYGERDKVLELYKTFKQIAASGEK